MAFVFVQEIVDIVIADDSELAERLALEPVAPLKEGFRASVD